MTLVSVSKLKPTPPLPSSAPLPPPLSSITPLLQLCSIPALLCPFFILLFSHSQSRYHFPPFPLPSPSPPLTPWLSVHHPQNYTSILLSRWLASSPCNNSLTSEISLPFTPITLPSSEITTLSFRALDEAGNPQCLGGDYFETDLSNPNWKSRPPVTDHGNGTYSVLLQVGTGFTGEFNFTITLLFRHFQGLKFSSVRFKYRKELRNIPIRFVKTNVSLPEIQTCKKEDFERGAWTGRWTRLTEDHKDCEVDEQGRYRCLVPDFPCAKPWCEGPLGLLESNGWVYSAHCSFKIFTQESAWKCLDKKWLFFWGDSNHVDTIRNLLNFVLGLEEIKTVPRRFDRNFTSNNGLWSVRITSVFNGHWNETKNYLGVDSLKNEEFRRYLRSYFLGDSVPDVAVFNSGLHDGVHFLSLRMFAQSAERATNFWDEVMREIEVRGKRRPRVFYRTTIATAGYARDLAYNPSKMEAFNGIMVDKMREKGLLGGGGGLVDQFDMSFPWHFDNRCSDGVHYGRAPAKEKWRDGEIGHQYFVDLMLVHVLLNAICNE
ncbi:hypothetical protein LUZ60_014068 [Juncus effusus]|nr:hypothetical protein LUZ60_014068 [Juncus effusus]